MRELKKNPGAIARRVEVNLKYLNCLYKGDFYELNGETLYFVGEKLGGWYVFNRVKYEWFEGNVAKVLNINVYRKESYLTYLKKSKDITPWTTILIETNPGEFKKIKNEIVRW